MAITQTHPRALPRAKRMAPDERRAAIVAAATPLIREHGRSVTTGQIAAAAEVSEGTLFHVFADKDAIIDAVIEVELSTDTVVAEIAALDQTLELLDHVVALVDVLRRRHGSVFELMTAVGMRRPPTASGHHDHRAAQATLLRAIADSLDTKRGELRYPPAESAALLRLLTFAATHPAISDGQQISAEQIADVLLYGVARSDSADPARTRDSARTCSC